MVEQSEIRGRFGIILVVTGLVTLVVADPLLATTLQLAVAVYVGASANDWRRWTLRRRGRVTRTL